MNTCTKVRALRSCSGDVHVARVVVSLVVHAVVGLTIGLIAHVVVVVFVEQFPQPFFCIWRFSLDTFLPLSKKFYQVALFDRTSGLFPTLEKTKHGRHPILNNLLKRSFP